MPGESWGSAHTRSGRPGLPPLNLGLLVSEVERVVATQLQERPQPQEAWCVRTRLGAAGGPQVQPCILQGSCSLAGGQGVAGLAAGLWAGQLGSWAI